MQGPNLQPVVVDAGRHDIALCLNGATCESDEHVLEIKTGENQQVFPSHALMFTFPALLMACFDVAAGAVKHDPLVWLRRQQRDFESFTCCWTKQICREYVWNHANPRVPKGKFPRFGAPWPRMRSQVFNAAWDGACRYAWCYGRTVHNAFARTARPKWFCWMLQGQRKSRDASSIKSLFLAPFSKPNLLPMPKQQGSTAMNSGTEHAAPGLLMLLRSCLCSGVLPHGLDQLR